MCLCTIMAIIRRTTHMYVQSQHSALPVLRPCRAVHLAGAVWVLRPDHKDRLVLVTRPMAYVVVVSVTAALTVAALAEARAVAEALGVAVVVLEEEDNLQTLKF